MMRPSPSRTSITISSRASDVEQAILDGAHQIALPALVSTLSICIVFVPMFQLAGIAKYLFIPLAEAVVFAMLASYILSRTLIPTLAKFWLKKKDEAHSGKRNRAWRASRSGSSTGSSACATATGSCSTLAIDGGARFAGVFLLAMAAAALLAFPIGPLPGLGQDFFPTVDAGQLKLHLRAPTGHAHRGDRDALRSGGENDPRHHQAGRDHLHRR